MKDLYGQLQVLEKEGQELSREERLRAMNGPLLSWYKAYARVLPWREEPTPYRVWISEIMLQQTRVEAVKPYFHRFMDALPTVQDLAAVPEEQLLKLWEGLGYYNRAKNLKKAAVLLMQEYGGIMPASYEELQKLPGIGSYTAGAIASIAFRIPAPAVDGNVLRVISRVTASREDILKQSVKKQMEKELMITMPKDRTSEFCQGLIEVGAIVCVPNGHPKCGECPLESICLAKRQGLISEIPVKTPKKERRLEKRTVLILEYRDRIALNKRPDQGLLSSLYEFPNVEGWLSQAEIADCFGLSREHIKAVEDLPKAKHVFSHVEWHMIGYRVILDKNMPDCYIEAEKLQIKEKYPLPNAFRTYIQLVK